MAETLQLVITGDNREAIKAIQDTIKSTEGLKSQFQTLGAASGQANQALVNSGRVLQDLNYGFVGIANNLNPLLESFQRLGERAKDTGTTIGKELKSALMGPAGLGVALSALTFLFLKFGDDITKFIDEKLTGLGKAFETESGILVKSEDAYVKASTSIDNLKNSYKLLQEGVITKDKFLKEYNSTLGDTIAKTNDLATAEKFLQDHSQDYIKMMFDKAVAAEASAQSAKKAIESELAKAKPDISFANILERATSFYYGVNATEAGKANKNALLKQNDETKTILDKIASDYNNSANKIQADLARIFGPSDTSKAKTKDAFTEATKQWEDANKNNAELLKAGVITQEQYFDEAAKISENYYNKIKDINTKIAIETAKMLAPKQFKKDESYSPELEQKFREDIQVKSSPLISQDFGFSPANKAQLKAGKEITDNWFKDLRDKLKMSKEEFAKFSDFMASQVTTAVSSVFEAMKNGENVVDALGNAFLKLAENIAMAIIQQEIYNSISSAMKIGSAVASGGATAAGGGVLDFIMSLFKPHATGGITTGPSLGLIGEAGPEAIVPLSKMGSMLKSTFNAGAMSGGSAGGGGQFVLRGQDLLLSVNRAQKAGNIKGQSISLA